MPSAFERYPGYLIKVHSNITAALLFKKGFVEKLLRFGDEKSELDSLFQHFNPHIDHMSQVLDIHHHSDPTSLDHSKRSLALYNEVQEAKKCYNFVEIANFFKNLEQQMNSYKATKLNETTTLNDVKKSLETLYAAKKIETMKADSEPNVVEFKDEMFVYKLETIILVR